MLAIAEPECKPAQFVRQCRIEMQFLAAQLQPGKAALQQVDRAGHGAEMDAFARGPSLNIADVALQSLREERPGALPARARQYPGMHERAQGGAVRAAPQIVVDGSGDRARIERVAKA